MSSVRDRIRDLQHSERKPDEAASTPTTSVSKIAKSLDAPSDPVSTNPPAPALDQGIGARVRRFNATSSASPSSPASASASAPTPARSIPASKSLQPSASPVTLASHTSSTLLIHSSTIQPVRRAASDNEDGRVARGRIGETSDKPTSETHVGNARRKFEAQQGNLDNAASGAHPKIQMTTTKKTTEVVTTVYSRPSALETAGTYGVPTGGAIVHGTGKEDFSKDGKDAMSVRAAIFEKPASPKREIIQAVEKPEHLNHKNVTSNGSNDNKHLQEELAEVRALNEKLVKSLLDLNEQYCRLEKSRDNLQKRIAELEASAK